MNPGALRHKVIIQEDQGTTRNSKGETVPNWVDVTTVWAAIEPLKGKEYFAAEQVQAEVTTRIRMRYQAGLKPEMRIKYGTRYFYIQSPPINLNEQNREIHLMCKEKF